MSTIPYAGILEFCKTIEEVYESTLRGGGAEHLSIRKSIVQYRCLLGAENWQAFHAGRDWF
jgi:hypothetical protein